MAKKSAQTAAQIEALRTRLQEAEETIKAIRSGKVDAVVVSGSAGEQVFTLKGADRSYRTILEKMAEGALTVSGTSILYSNRCFAEMVAAPLRSVIGSSFLRFLAEKDKARFERLLKGAAKQSAKDEFCLIRKDKTEVSVNVSVSPIEIDDETAQCLIVTDLTLRNSAEKEILKNKADLEVQVLKRTAELALSNKELVRSNRELEQFAYIASHDLQEPLRTITNYVDLVLLRQKENLDPNGVQFLEYIHEGAVHAQELVRSLLAYASISSSDSSREKTAMLPLLQQAIAGLRAAVEESGAEITHDRLPKLSVNKTQIVQLFSNLLSNALKYRHKNRAPKVHVSAKQEKAMWIFTVKDNGIGIDPEYKERVFMIFKRLHSRHQYPGTGIGLAVCKKIVQHHGGEIWLESEPQKGTRFYFTLPSD